MHDLTKRAAVLCAALALGTGTASAAIVCNDEGDCWRVRGHAEYNPELRLRIHDDDWRWQESEQYRWREPGPGYGYWRGGVWVGID